MICDVTLSQIRNLSMAGSQLLRYETNTQIILYYVNQGPVIFRAIIGRPEDTTEYQLMLTSLPKNLRVMNVIETESVTLRILQTLEDFKINQEAVNDRLVRISESSSDPNS